MQTGGTALAVLPYQISVSRDPLEVREAQRLRHRVFARELGATLTDRQPGIDADDFDAYCDHLLVRRRSDGLVVGTYRLLPPDAAAGAGRLYSDGEFDLTALENCRPALVEAGRSCVHPEHRNGAVIGLLWAGIARYVVTTGARWLAGCASVPLDDGGVTAAGVWTTARERYLSDFRVTPHNPWTAADGVPPLGNSGLPPLLRGYLRLGAKVCGPPAYDPDFHTADFFVLLDAENANPRYLRRLVDGLA